MKRLIASTNFRSGRSSRRERMSRGEFIALIAAMFALGGLALDIVVPALPQMGAALGVANANDLQALIVIYLLGFAIGQLAFGRMSDVYGRKPVLVAGMAIFMAGTLLAALSSDLVRSCWRLVQGDRRRGDPRHRRRPGARPLFGKRDGTRDVHRHGGSSPFPCWRPRLAMDC